jgi:hypothetical protein
MSRLQSPEANSRAILILSAFSIPCTIAATGAPGRRQAIQPSRLVFETI